MSSSDQVTATTNSEQVRAAHRDYLFPCAPPLYNEPIVLAEGHGVTAVDAEGREYLDFFSGILTTAIGHCHPEVVERVREQVGILGHTSTLYLTENQTRVARRLNEIAPGKLSKSFFTNSGTEAVETAVMLACMYTGRSDVIALRYAYSGRSILATNLTAHSGNLRALAQIASQSLELKRKGVCQRIAPGERGRPGLLGRQIGDFMV